MKNCKNTLGQPIGFAIENFEAPPRPNFTMLTGNFVRVEPISAMDLPVLYNAFSLDSEGYNWTYMPYGPFAHENDFTNWAETTCFSEDPKFYSILLEQRPAGVASFLRIEPKVGCIEIGHIHLSPLIQRTRMGTEALLLMIEWAFQAGYRRVEWKCDAFNKRSRHAAQRLGLSFEGIFRQATIYKSRNRDTAWYAATSEDWPSLENAYRVWRNPENFDVHGQEIRKLSELTSNILVNCG